MLCEVEQPQLYFNYDKEADLHILVRKHLLKKLTGQKDYNIQSEFFITKVF